MLQQGAVINANKDVRAFSQMQDSLSYLLEPPSVSATFKQSADDFQVEEKLKFTLNGEGQHLCLLVEKKYINTLDVIFVLARFFQVPKRDIGYFGLKDKQALCKQWFSIDLGQSPFDEAHCALFETQYPQLLPPFLATRSSKNAEQEPQIAIIETNRNLKKLRQGQHAANIFRMVLRDISDKEMPENDWCAIRANLETRLAAIQQYGFANYFGEQRFGARNESQQQQNILQLTQYASENLVKNRTLRGRLISTLRSLIFNHYLSRRIHDDSYKTYIDGDVMQFRDGRSLLRVDVQNSVESSQDLQQRIDNNVLVITGPLCGVDASMASGESLLLEQAIANHYQSVLPLLEKFRVEGDRRALICFPSMLSWYFEDRTLILHFELAAGAFATSLIRDVVVI